LVRLSYSNACRADARREFEPARQTRAGHQLRDYSDITFAAIKNRPAPDADMVRPAPFVTVKTVGQFNKMPAALKLR
jgi:hypothetical protein